MDQNTDSLQESLRTQVLCLKQQNKEIQQQSQCIVPQQVGLKTRDKLIIS